MAKKPKDIDEAFKNECLSALAKDIYPLNKRAQSSDFEGALLAVATVFGIVMCAIGTYTTLKWGYGTTRDAARDFVKAEIRVRECVNQKDWAGRAMTEDDCRQVWR